MFVAKYKQNKILSKLDIFSKEKKTQQTTKLNNSIIISIFVLQDFGFFHRQY